MTPGEKAQPESPAQTPPREPIPEESNDDNGDFYKFKRGTAQDKPGSASMAMGKNGWGPSTVKDMGTRRKRDVTLPHRPEGMSGVDEEFHTKENGQPPQEMKGPKHRALMQAKESSTMTMERLPEDDQRQLFDRMVSVELARAIELRNNSEGAMDQGFDDEPADLGEGFDDLESGFDEPGQQY